MTTASDKQLSPAMAQYHRWKVEYPGELLFFRMGDFFELFYDDAKLAARVLGLALTSRTKGPDAIPMAGVPVRSVDHYLKKLVAQGHRVAICDQIQDPKDADGVVDRAVTRIVTAGTITEDDLLDGARPNFLAAAHADGERCGLAFVDLSTGQFRVEDVGAGDGAEAVLRRGAAEVLVAEAAAESPLIAELKRCGVRAITVRPDWQFERTAALESFSDHFRVRGLDGFGIDPASPVVGAAGAALRYLADTQKTRLEHLEPPRLAADGERLVLDRATRSCLELTESAREGRRDGSLLSVIDATVTALGARKLREWLLAPLAERAAIERRQAAVAELVEETALARKIAEELRRVADVERLLTRIVTNRASARDLVNLRTSLAVVPALQALLGAARASELADLCGRLEALPELVDELARALVDDPPLALKEGGLLRDGFDAGLDELRHIQRDGKRFILDYQVKEVARTGIQNLKVGFNRVFGFYIEITNSWRDQIPVDYLRKQTLKNCERYITPDLKEYESKVLHAEERSCALEYEIFLRLRDAVLAKTAEIKRTAASLAELDALRSLAQVAQLNGWCRPALLDESVLEIDEGRHPVLAGALGASAFVPNDCRLDGATRRLAIVTGPNMAGKSTFIRQTALIQVLAQLGSFVPAKAARVGVADRVFARVGSSDDLMRGNSTFMVEMTETANILNNATDRSLVILDEVGRGTSTFDGMSLAWAISEHLLNASRSRTLFATHYHQLIDLAGHFPGVVNLNVAVREWGDEIVFLHRIVEGGSDRSYGIHVARLAGLPKSVLERAAAILKDLERSAPDLRPKAAGKPGAKPADRTQNLLFEPPERALMKELLALDLDRLAPLDALMRLQEWKRKLGAQK